MKTPCVYLLASKRNGVLYVGVTSNLAHRMVEHHEGLIPGHLMRNGFRSVRLPQNKRHAGEGGHPRRFPKNATSAGSLCDVTQTDSQRIENDEVIGQLIGIA